MPSPYILQRRLPYMSYLLRMWVSKGTDGDFRLETEVQSVQTGDKWRLAGIDELVNFLSSRAQEMET